ncbi:MAG: hypothetical protein EP332_01770 [Bacteroidetes bacterium]|nr:MAG: hypothetical protein EP332_01770 [Bacteroidota bacterium]
MNQLRTEKTQQEEEKQTEETPKKGLLIRFTEMAGLGDKAEVAQFMPFVFFLSFLTLVYIYNSHQAIKVVRQIDELNKEIKEYRAEYISVKSDFMYKSKQSQVAKRLEGTGLKELTQPPVKLTYDPDKDLK